MAKNQNTYAKRQREYEKKEKSEQKRQRRRLRQEQGPPAMVGPGEQQSVQNDSDPIADDDAGSAESRSL